LVSLREVTISIATPYRCDVLKVADVFRTLADECTPATRLEMVIETAEECMSDEEVIERMRAAELTSTKKEQPEQT